MCMEKYHSSNQLKTTSFIMWHECKVVTRVYITKSAHAVKISSLLTFCGAFFLWISQRLQKHALVYSVTTVITNSSLASSIDHARQILPRLGEGENVTLKRPKINEVLPALLFLICYSETPRGFCIEGSEGGNIGKFCRNYHGMPWFPKQK